jgi:hypothetical protein
MVKYSEDIVAWAIEQARYLRHRQFEQLDIENIADALEDIVKGEQRELAEHLASLTAITLKWTPKSRQQFKLYASVKR